MVVASRGGGIEVSVRSSRSRTGGRTGSRTRAREQPEGRGAAGAGRGVSPAKIVCIRIAAEDAFGRCPRRAGCLAHPATHTENALVIGIVARSGASQRSHDPVTRVRPRRAVLPHVYLVAWARDCNAPS